jgi:hypothetical protein
MTVSPRTKVVRSRRRVTRDCDARGFRSQPCRDPARAICCCAISSKESRVPRSTGARACALATSVVRVVADRSRPRAAMSRSPASCAWSPVQIDWLAQDPVTRVPKEGETSIPRAGSSPTNEPHRIRIGRTRPALLPGLARLDEILVANFMIFQDVIEEESHDLWIGDEVGARLLSTRTRTQARPFCWLTDFVGWPRCRTAELPRRSPTTTPK